MAKNNYLRFRLDGVEYTLRGDMSQEKMEAIVKVVEDKISAGYQRRVCCFCW